jgi:hypothetical protein
VEKKWALLVNFLPAGREGFGNSKENSNTRNAGSDKRLLLKKPDPGCK